MLYTWSRYNIVSQLYFNVKKTNKHLRDFLVVQLRFHASTAGATDSIPVRKVLHATECSQKNQNNNKQLSFIWLKDSGPHSLLAVRQEPL